MMSTSLISPLWYMLQSQCIAVSYRHEDIIIMAVKFNKFSVPWIPHT